VGFAGTAETLLVIAGSRIRQCACRAEPTIRPTPARLNPRGVAVARMGLAGQIPASTLLRCWKVRIVVFAHRVTDLPGCWVALMFTHPPAWVADRDRPAATSVPDRAANVCHLADTTGMNPAAT
jgi:hypothetical protein